MGCNNDFCEIEEKKPKPCCGVEPMKKINLLSTWIRCPKCGRCVAGDTYKEARLEWNRALKDSCRS
jgi:hypothetical protein